MLLGSSPMERCLELPAMIDQYVKKKKKKDKASLCVHSGMPLSPYLLIHNSI